MRMIVTALSVAALGAAAHAGPVNPGNVSFEDGAVAASLSGMAGNADEGRKVMTTRGLGNCIACHAVTALNDFPFHGEVGPPLDGVGSRWSEAELRGIVTNAKMMFEDTVMPAFYKSSGFVRPGNKFTGKAGQEPLAPLLTAQQVEDVVAYLLTLQE